MAFPETRWSMLALATIHGDPVARQALDELCRRYWPPVYAAIRSQGSGEDEARDRTQSFFVTVQVPSGVGVVVSDEQKGSRDRSGGQGEGRRSG